MNTEPQKNKVLNPTVVKLGLISLLADISSEMLYPITPIFLTTVLGASMTSVGFIEGFAEAMASLMKTYSGTWSDRIAKRKPFIIVGYFLSGIAKPMTGAATSWTHVLFARGLDRTGKGLRTAPRDAMLAESVSLKLRGSAFGWHRMMDTMGAAIGPLVALAYLNYGSGDLRQIFYWALLPGLAAVGVSFLIKEKVKAPPKIDSKIQLFKGTPLSRPFKTYLVSWTIFSLTNSSDIFLLLKAKQEGLSLSSVILIYCFYNLVYASMSPYFGGLSDRIGRKKVLLGGLFVFALIYLSFSFASETWHFWALFAVYGMYMAATEGNGKAYAVDLARPEEKARGLGILGTFTGLAMLVASTAAGAIWENFGSTWTFVYAAMGALIAAAVLIFVEEKATSKY